MSDDDARAHGEEQDDRPDPDLDPASAPEPRGDIGPVLEEPPGPVNWNLLSAHDAEQAWLELNQWVNWLRATYGLPAAVVPPMWHRHPELLWELSALHTHWLNAYDPQQNGSAPVGWLRDFADARQRLRDWVAASGTRLDRDRPTRQTVWPGEDDAGPIEDTSITNRDEDFVAFVIADVERRRQVERDHYASLNPVTGEVT